MGDNFIQEAYFQTPVVTRSYATACFLTTLACQLEIISPFNLYFNLDLILRHHQYWRLITNFLYFGYFDLDFIFHMFFLVKYCRMLEEGSFRGRAADFFYMIMFAASFMTILEPFAGVYFLGPALTFMLVYLWGRRNPRMRMSFLGLFFFSAPYLPWVLLGFSLLLNHSPVADLIGIAVGHVYFFLEDVYPSPRSQGGLGGPRYLATPSFIKSLFGDGNADVEFDIPANERPGLYEWGDGMAVGQGGEAAGAVNGEADDEEEGARHPHDD